MFNGFWRPVWLGRGRDPLRAAAYTTVMTTLDRLFKKGFVQRTRDGRAFQYSPAYSRQQVEAAVATGLLTGFLEDGHTAARPLLSNLVDVVAERDDELLDELAALVQEKQRDAAERAKRGTR